MTEWRGEPRKATKRLEYGKNPRSQARAAAPSGKPRRNPSRKDARRFGSPVPKQWAGQASPHQLHQTLQTPIVSELDPYSST